MRRADGRKNGDFIKLDEFIWRFRWFACQCYLHWDIALDGQFAPLCFNWKLFYMVSWKPPTLFFTFINNHFIYYFETREEAKKTVFEYIEVFYNQRRRHSYLDYKSPAEFENSAINF